MYNKDSDNPLFGGGPAPLMGCLLKTSQMRTTLKLVHAKIKIAFYVLQPPVYGAFIQNRLHVLTSSGAGSFFLSFFQLIVSCW